MRTLVQTMANKYAVQLREAGGSESTCTLAARVIPLYTTNEDPRFLGIPHRKMVL